MSVSSSYPKCNTIKERKPISILADYACRIQQENGEWIYGTSLENHRLIRDKLGDTACIYPDIDFKTGDKDAYVVPEQVHSHFTYTFAIKFSIEINNQDFWFFSLDTMTFVVGCNSLPRIPGSPDNEHFYFDVSDTP